MQALRTENEQLKVDKAQLEVAVKDLNAKLAGN